VIAFLDDICKEETCPVMCAGPMTYFWHDDDNPLPARVSAPEYMKRLAEYSFSILSSEAMPQREDSPIPENFMETMAQLHRRLFRVYAHTYLHHQQLLLHHEVAAHLNYCFKHFLAFVQEFNLIDEPELAPVAHLITKFRAQSRQ